MAVSVTNLTMGPGEIYKGEFGATEPADSDVSNRIPETSVSADWTDLGGTNGGVTLELELEYTELEVDQIVDIVGRRLTKREMKINTSLAETTLENFRIANNGGTITTGAGYQAFDPKMDTSAATPEYIALIFDGVNGDSSLRRRVLARRVLSVAGIGQEYSKDSQTLFPVEFSCHYVSSSIAPFKYVDEVPTP
jgi:hypothetical protein